MYILPVSVSQNSLNGISQKKQVNTFSKQHKADEVSFTGGLRPEIIKNQLKIYLSQDIWAEHLNVKMPEAPIEKEAILEVLQNRLKLDRFARLCNEKARLKTKVIELNNLMEKDPLNPNLPKLRQELENKGNLSSVFKTLDKQIEIESKKNKPALDYFKNLDKLEDEYLGKRLVRYTKMDKFWHKILNNNINKDGKYSTKELIDIISNDKVSVNTVKNVSKPLSKKELLLKAEKEYEQYLRENIDIYEGRIDHTDDVLKGRQFVKDVNKEIIQKYPGIEKNIVNLFRAVEKKYKFKTRQLPNVQVYPIEEIWKDMRVVEADMKDALKDIATLKEHIALCPENKVFKETLDSREKVVEKLKQDWIEGMKISLNYENTNREIFKEVNGLPVYEYLAGENKIIKKHRAALAVYEANKGVIPDNYWKEILG